MADFILEYDILESIANNSKALGKRSKEYSEKLESKIITGIDRVAGPSSGYLTSASDSVRDKINALKLKSDAFYHFADQITNLLEVAEQIDQEVADAIAAQREYFLDHHEALRIDDWKAKLLGLIVDIKNSIPLLDTIADILDGLKAVFEALEDSIKHWYECEGGKYIVRAVGSVVVAAVSVALFVAAFPVSGFFAVCGAIGAGIAAINGITNVATSFRAADAAIDGDPAWAVIYGKQDKLSDVLRQTNFGSGGWNALSNLGAGALDTTETICDVVGFAEIGKNAIKLFKGDAFKFLKNKGSMDFSDLKNGSKSDIVDLKNNILDGYADSKNGIKEITPPKSSLGDMSVDDLTRYNKHWDDVATGAHDIPYGMNAEEYYQHLKEFDKVDDVVKGGSDTVKYYRVQGGGTGNQTSQYRIIINGDGSISIPNKNADLNISAYDLEHAQYFRDTARPGGEIVEFEVPKYLDDLIKENVVDQYGYTKNPLNQGGTAPKLVDPTTPGVSYELPSSPWLEWLEEYAHSSKIIE